MHHKWESLLQLFVQLYPFSQQSHLENYIAEDLAKQLQKSVPVILSSATAIGELDW